MEMIFGKTDIYDIIGESNIIKMKKQIKRRAKIDGSNIPAQDEFIITEYERIKDMLIYTSEMGHSRVQFFISIISAVGATLLVLFQVQGFSGRFIFVLFVFIVGLIVFGSMLFVRLTRRVISKVQYFRALAKIRRYFVDRNTELEKYFYYSCNDDEPSFGSDNNPTFSSLRLTISMINSMLWAGLSVCLVYFIFNGNIDWWHFVNLAIFVFAISFASQELYSRYEFVKASKDYEDRIHFPDSPNKVKTGRVVKIAVKKITKKK